MRLYLSGTVTFDNSRIGRGTGTNFMVELRPGDVIAAAQYELTVYAVIDAVTFIASSVATFSDAVCEILSVNPAYVISELRPDYANYTVNMGSVLPNFAKSTLLGGQVFHTAYSRSTLKLTDARGVMLDSKFNYDTYVTDRLLMQTRADSPTLELCDTSVTLSIRENSNLATFVSGDARLLAWGTLLSINGRVYSVYSAAGEVFLDRPAHATAIAAVCRCPQDVNTRYPVGSNVLVNGRVCAVLSSNTKAIRLTYSIDTMDAVFVCKPIMARQYSKNTISLYNNILPGALSPGDAIVIQDVQSPDSLYATNRCYTEVKHVARMYGDTELVTTEVNRRIFEGIACIGWPNTGVKYLCHARLQGNRVSIPFGETNFTSIYHVGDYAVIDYIPYLITAVTDVSLTLDGLHAQSPTVKSLHYVPVPTTGSYTPAIKRIAFKEVSRILAGLPRQSWSLGELLRRHTTVRLFAYECGVFPNRSFGVYNPKLFASNAYAAPPTNIQQLHAICIKLSSAAYSATGAVVQRTGKRIGTIN